jgi:hypothetical protein
VDSLPTNIDRSFRRFGRILGGFLILFGLTLSVAVALSDRSVGFGEVGALVIGAILATAGFLVAGLDRAVAFLWRRVTIRRLVRTLTRHLGSAVEIGPDFSSLRWVGSRNGNAAAVTWSLDGPFTQASIRIDEGTPGTLRILPNLRRGGRLIGGRTIPTGHAGFDGQFLVRSEPPSLIPDLFKGERRDALAGTLMGLARAEYGRVILTRADLRILLPGILRRPEDLEALLSAAETAVQALRSMVREGGYAVLTVGAGSGGRCPVCLSGLDADVVLCARCRSPHHQGCWEYTRECALFACGGRRWVAPPPGARDGVPS